MNQFEVPEPILNSPYVEPAEHWWITEGEPPERRPGRRRAVYHYRSPAAETALIPTEEVGTVIELKLVNLVRDRVGSWHSQGWPGVSRTTLELLQYWRREGRRERLFFAQMEAVETILFLVEARPDFLQGIEIPLDEPSDDRRAEGYSAFRRYACKMATGSGKTTVMAMLAVWSILNKIANRSDARYSDTVLVVCPNVTIRSRLAELDPRTDEASLYRKRDLVPAHLMPALREGRVLITNWHVFEPQSVQAGGVSTRVVKAGVPTPVREKIIIGVRTTTARGKRYLTPEELTRQTAAGLLSVIEENRDREGHLKSIIVESFKYVESDTSLLNRILDREVGGKRNLLVFNDEAHHAYRIRKTEPDSFEEDQFGEEEEGEEFFREATVWVDGLDKVHKHRGINFCVDLSATPYYLGRVGQQTNRPFPWVVSDFGLTDAIESGLVKIPQLAVRDTTGSEIPAYFNIWRWILPRLTASERGGRKGTVKPEAILRHAHVPMAMLGGLWEEQRREWAARGGDPRPPVFIIVCKDTRIAKLVHEWIAEGKAPTGIPPAHLEGLRNTTGRINTIRVDSKIVHETDTGEAKSDESRWMRLTLDTIGRPAWPADRQQRPVYPDGFEELAVKLRRPLHPPGRDVRCIVSVGMLTEGWDCNTVTHIIGLRPFMSQLLCEQVVGRGLRRTVYEVGEDGKLTEEVAKILGVPFEVIPFKENKNSQQAPPPMRHHVHAIPEKSRFEIRFPRVEGFRQAIRNRVTVNWSEVRSLRLDPTDIPPEVQMKALLPNNKGRPSLMGPGAIAEVNLNPYRARRRLQELVFELATALTREYASRESCEAPSHVLFPQIVKIVERYLKEKVRPVRPAEIRDVFLAPYYGWVIEVLLEAIRPDASQGEAPELPRYEQGRGPGSTSEVDFWTSRDVRPVVHSHLNYVVADTKKWEQSVAYRIDTHETVEAFVKNAGLGFAIPYIFNGEPRDYEPDFIIRLKGAPDAYLILETKGYDPMKEAKKEAALRWVAAINADRRHGQWGYAMAEDLTDTDGILRAAASSALASRASA